MIRVERTEGFDARLEELRPQFPRLPEAIRGVITALRSGPGHVGELADESKQIYVAPLADVFGPAIHVAFAVQIKHSAMTVRLIDIHVRTP